MMALKFEDLRYANGQRQKEWDPDGKITPLFAALELAGEVGELMNMVKKMEREKLGLVGTTIRYSELAEEFADVLVTLDLLAMHFSIDLGYVTQLKFNKDSRAKGFETRLEEDNIKSYSDVLSYKPMEKS